MKQHKKHLLSGLVVMLLLLLVPMQAFAAEATMSYLTFSDATVSGTTATMSATRSKGASEATTKTVTITNNSADYTIQIEFDYEGYTGGGSGDKGSYTINAPTNGTNVSDTGSHKIIQLQPKGNFAVTIVADDDWGSWGSSTYYFKMTNVVQSIVYTSTDLTVNYNGDLGTVKYGDTTVDAGSTISDIAKDETLTATATNGTFLGWVDTAGKILTTSNTYAVTPTADAMTVQAVFASADTSAWFWVDNTYLTNNLTTATSLGSSIILAADGTLTGSHTIPSGDTVLIPYSSANLFRGVPTEWSFQDMSLSRETSPDSPEVSIINFSDRTSTADTEYRRLTMAEGASITVSGALEVSGQTDPFGRGQRGAYGLIQMEGNNSITVKNGATLYAYGYIRGSGTVTAESGGIIYEHIDVLDYPGAGAGGMDELNTAGVFGMRDYSINNIEVPTTYASGATLKSYIVVTGAKIGTNAFIRDFIGNGTNAMFQLTSGTMTKSYVDGRQKITISGAASLNPFCIEMSFAVIDYKMDSAATSGLPLGRVFDIIVADGASATLNDSFVMYAGSSFTVDQGGKFVIPSGYNAYVLDLSSDPVLVDTSNPSGDVITVTSGAKLDVNGEIEVNGGLYTTHYNDSTYASITSSLGTGKITANNVGAATTVAVRQGYNAHSTVSCNITPAKLQNADGSYITSAADTYYYANSVWNCTNHTEATGDGDHTCDVCGTANVTSCADATDDGNHNCDECAAANITTCIAGDAVTENKVAAKCESTGSYDTVTYCTECEKALSRVTTTEDALGHSYGDTAYDWSDDGKTCTATRSCTRTDCTHSETENATVTSEITGQPNCSVKGTTTYTASFTVDWAAQQTTTRQDVEALGHIDADNDGDHICDRENCKVDGVTDCEDKLDGVKDHTCDTDSACNVYSTGKNAHADSATDNDHVCDYCGKAVGEHSYDKQMTTDAYKASDATCTAAAMYYYSCNCGAQGTETFAYGDVNTENHVNTTNHAQTDATCTDIGYTAGTYCNDCKTWVSGHEEIPAKSHDWTVGYAWSDDHSTCTATRACGNDTSHNVTETVTATSAVKTAATCTAKGTTTYTATFTETWAEVQTKDVQDIAQLSHSYTGAIKSDGDGEDATHSFKCVNGCEAYGNAVTHTWDEGKQTTAPTCTAAGEMTYTCTVEGCGATYTEEIAANDHSFGTKDSSQQATAATCIAKQTNYVQCDNCDAVSSTKTVEVGEKLAHTYGDPTWSWTGNDTDGYTAATATFKCTCGDERSETDSEIDKVTTDATATTDGETVYTAEVTFEGDNYSVTKKVTIPATGTPECEHSYSETVTTPTCSEAGYITYTCSKCGDNYTEAGEPATGEHNYMNDACKDCEAALDAGTVTHVGRTLEFQHVVYINLYTKFDFAELSQDYIEKNSGLLTWASEISEDDAVYGHEAADVNKGTTYSGASRGYQAKSDGIVSTHYADEMYIRSYLKLSDGSYVYGPLQEYSAQIYCQNQLSKSSASEEMKNVCAALLHYGAAAQIRFNYNTDDLANANIAENWPEYAETAEKYAYSESYVDIPAEPTTEIMQSNSVTRYGRTLALDGAIFANYYYKVNGFTPVKAKLLVWDSVEGALTVDNVSYTCDMVYDDYYSAYKGQSKGFASTEYGKDVYFCAVFEDADGNVHYSDVNGYNPEAYAYNQINKETAKEAMKEVCRRLIVFGEMAIIRFGS